MRIGSGFAKGMRLVVPEGVATRPTSAKVRASILNMVQPETPGALVLDLFSGSGAMGLEAISRGARGAVLVENAKGALSALRQNLDELKRRAANANASVAPLVAVGRDAIEALPSLASHGKFDLVFADPPYREAKAAFLALGKGLKCLLSADGLWLFESGLDYGETVESDLPSGWQIVKQRSHGDTMVTILELASE